ncbi:MAG: transglycosylase family protein, partial [Solirubrobacterales bacterium]
LVANGRERTAALRDQHRDTQRRLRAARSRLKRAQKVLAERPVAIYKGGMPGAGAVSLEADGYSDIASRGTYLAALSEGDQDVAARVRDVRGQVKNEVLEVRELERKAAEHARELERARKTVSSAARRARGQVADFAEARSAQARRLGRLRGKIDAWTDAVQRAERVSRAEARRRVVGQLQAPSQSPGSAPRSPGRSPSPQGNGKYSVPTSVVMCESGGNYGAVNPGSGAGGAYQIIPDTWRRYGGKGKPQNAPKRQQDRIAAQIWADSGSSAWSCS